MTSASRSCSLDYTVQNQDNQVVLKDDTPSYERSDQIFDSFIDRMEDAIDEERYLPDEYSVAVLAMKIGLCHIENSEKDAIELRNQVWLETGEHEKLKKALIEEMQNELGTYNLQNLESLSAEEVLEFYTKINECRE